MSDPVIVLLLLVLLVVAAVVIVWFMRSRSRSASTGPAPSAAPAAAPAASVEAGPYGPGSAAVLPDGSAPAGFTIKGNADSMLFHTTDSPYYGRTRAEAWFRTEADATRAGFARWDSR